MIKVSPVIIAMWINIDKKIYEGVSKNESFKVMTESSTFC
jgi:hypothetical protein